MVEVDCIHEEPSSLAHLSTRLLVVSAAQRFVCHSKFPSSQHGNLQQIEEKKKNPRSETTWTPIPPRDFRFSVQAYHLCLLSQRAAALSSAIIRLSLERLPAALGYTASWATAAAATAAF